MYINEAEQDITFVERLRTFMELRNLNRDQLALLIGITATTVHRWETGSTRPSRSAASKLECHGFGSISLSDTNSASIARLSTSSKTKTELANRLKDESKLSVSTKHGEIDVIPAPFVRNGPPDQVNFYNRMIRMQGQSDLPLAELLTRLSLVEEIQEHGPSSQFLLENSKPVAVSWNSNYGPHGWHRYVGRFPPHVVRSLLNHFGANKDSVVCDPFLGSGTTAVECRLLGIPFVGIEICPLSAMISRTKSSFPLDPSELQKVTDNFSNFYATQWSAFVGKRIVESLTHQEIIDRKGNLVPTFTNIEKWFTPGALLGTSIAVEFGMGLRGYLREAVLSALSGKMRSIGNLDVDVVRAEYRKQPRVGVDVQKLVQRHLSKMVGDIQKSVTSHSGTIAKQPNITVVEESVLDTDLGENSIDYVITSPPYGVEAISYLRTHLLSYRSLVTHLKHDPYTTRDKTIGSEYLTESSANSGNKSRKISRTCDDFFNNTPDSTEKKYLQRRSAMMQFCDEMHSTGKQLARWLRPKGKVAFVIGNKRLGDDIVPMDKIVIELFECCGLLHQDTIRHKLKTNNSNSQVPWQDKVIQEESILIFDRANK